MHVCAGTPRRLGLDVLTVLNDVRGRILLDLALVVPRQSTGQTLDRNLGHGSGVKGIQDFGVGKNIPSLSSLDASRN